MLQITYNTHFLAFYNNSNCNLFMTLLESILYEYSNLINKKYKTKQKARFFFCKRNRIVVLGRLKTNVNHCT